jgi:hypothetical protein
LRLKEAKKLAKASANKADKADAGIAQCSLFLQDVVRRGFSQLAQAPMDFDGLSAQLIDAQLPGLARLMREAGVIHDNGIGWENRLMRT